MLFMDPYPLLVYILFVPLSFLSKKRGMIMLQELIMQYPDDAAVLELIERFKRLLIKYAYKLDYEDAYNDLQLFFIELITKLKYTGPAKKDDAIIVSYIAISIKNQYIKLSAKKSLSIVTYSDLSDSQLHFINSTNATTLPVSIEEYLPHNNELTRWERQVIIDYFVNGLSISDIAHIHKKSRQAVNQAKNRGLNKIITSMHK